MCHVRCSFFLQVLLFVCVDTRYFFVLFLQIYCLAAGTLYANLIVPSYKNVCPWHGKMSNRSFIAFISRDVERILVQFLGRVATLEGELTVNPPTTDPLNVPGSAVALAGVCSLLIKMLTRSIGCILWDKKKAFHCLRDYSECE